MRGLPLLPGVEIDMHRVTACLFGIMCCSNLGEIVFIWSPRTTDDNSGPEIALNYRAHIPHDDEVLPLP